jgi:hypothetical protein
MLIAVFDSVATLAAEAAGHRHGGHGRMSGRRFDGFAGRGTA